MVAELRKLNPTVTYKCVHNPFMWFCVLCLVLRTLEIEIVDRMDFSLVYCQKMVSERMMYITPLIGRHKSKIQ